MSFYSNLEATATRLITSKGRSLTFTRKTQGAFNQATRAFALTPSTYDKNCVSLGPVDLEKAGALVQAGDQTLLGEAHTYAIGDEVSIDSETWVVVQVRPIKPGDTLLACYVDIRK